MAIDSDNELNKITTLLNQAEGYLDCEKVVIHNLKKHLDNGNSDESIIEYLNKLSIGLTKKTEIDQLSADCTNYRYAAGFIDTLLKMPYWRSWMQTIKM